MLRARLQPGRGPTASWKISVRQRWTSGARRSSASSRGQGCTKRNKAIFSVPLAKSQPYIQGSVLKQTLFMTHFDFQRSSFCNKNFICQKNLSQTPRSNTTTSKDALLNPHLNARRWMRYQQPAKTESQNHRITE